MFGWFSQCYGVFVCLFVLTSIICIYLTKGNMQHPSILPKYMRAPQPQPASVVNWSGARAEFTLWRLKGPVALGMIVQCSC